MRKSSTTTNALASSGRLAGIELMRGVAAFAVIVIHAGLVVQHHVTFAASRWQLLFKFVVPFFLLTSFFFALRGERTKALSWREWMRRRASRLLVPYLAWTAIYAGLRLVRFYAAHGTWGPEEIFRDPLGIFISGGTSVALYFLPLLFTGWILIRLLRSFLLQAPLGLLVAAFLISAAANQMLQQSGNGYDITLKEGFGVIFPGWNEIGPVRLLLVMLAHAIRALPLVFVAAALVRHLPAPNGNPWPMAAVGLGLCLVAAFTVLRIGDLFLDMTWGLGTFLLAWEASALLASNRIITLLGAFSFGVYLVHQVVLEAMQAVVLRVMPDPAPMGLGGILAISVLAFGLSLLIVGLAAKTPLRSIFGLEGQP